MSLRALLKAAWTDSVWSKVIATGIIAALGALATAVVGYWPKLLSTSVAFATIAFNDVSVPVWLAALLLLGAMCVGFWSGRYTGAKRPATREDAEPNALLIQQGSIAGVPGGERLPIREAMRRAYEQLEDDPVSPFIEEGNQGNPEGKLQYLADVMLCMNNPPFDIQGVRPPSTVPRSIEGDRARLHLVPGTNDLQAVFGGSAYVNVTVSVESLNQFIQRMRDTGRV